MAGSGYKLYATGDVLTAAQVNNYLQEQTVMVFASAAARTTALASVLAEGMISYLKDTDVTQYYSGSAWVSIGGASNVGSTLISTASFTTASSVSLATDSFTSTYDNYKLIINISTFVGTNTYLYGRLRAAGSDNTTTNYTSQFCLFSQTATTVTNDHGGAASSAFARLGYVYSAAPEYIQVDIFNPKATAKTSYAGTVGGVTTEGWINSGLFNATTSFDSFSFYPTAGTLTGTYSLYGYNK